MKRRNYFAVFAIFFLVIVSLVLFFLFHKNSNYVTINGNNIKVEVADSQPEMERGLMWRENLDADSGMLFVFSGSEIRSFWMKNTLMPLDILFISEEFKIVDIQNMQPCYDSMCPNYVSSEPAKYALEVNSGFCDLHSIKVGDRAEFLNAPMPYSLLNSKKNIAK